MYARVGRIRARRPVRVGRIDARGALQLAVEGFAEGL